MSILDAVITLATLVKQSADDAAANTEHCAALSDRIQRIPRILSKFPNSSDLDEELLSKIFALLKESHEFIRDHNAQGRLRRMVNASNTKQKFEQLATELGVCLDDLNLCVGITSAAKLSQLQDGTEAVHVASGSENEVAPLITDITFSSVIDPLEYGRGYFFRSGFHRNRPVVCHEYLQLCQNVSPVAHQKFDSEIQRLKQLSHTNVVSLYHAYLENSNIYIIQEGFSSSQNLTSYVATSPALNSLLSIYLGITAGLFYLHSQSPPVIHGALTPLQIQVTSYGVAKITSLEYRCVHVLLSTTEANTWAAPEHILANTASAAGDIFSLGLVLAYGVSKQMPVPVMHSLLQQVQYYTAPSFSTHKSLQDLIRACINVEPISRPSAVSVWRTLSSICAECGAAQMQVDPITPALDEDDADFCLSDFGEMASQVESIHRNVKYFRHKNLSITCIGNKVVAQNIPKEVLIVDEESECTGTIVFHIDTTTSMSREHRMDITRDILLQVIPPFLMRKYHVIINAWASNVTTKGCIQPREIQSSSENIDELKSITQEAMSHLTPNGRTDLYGSVYQLLKQCATLPHRPVQAFVITDGNHNQLDYPQHKSEKGEKYFDTFVGAANGLWKKTNKHFNIENAETYLGELYASLFPNEELNISFIGIGEAHTKSLSDLSKALHKHSSFYGITETKQIDAVLQHITVAKVIEIAYSGVKIPLSYTFEDSGVTSGLATVHNADELEKLYQQNSLSVMCGDDKHVLPCCSMDSQLCADINDFAAQLRSVRDSTYEINEASLSHIFQKLMTDKKYLLSLKSAYYSKNTKKLRYQDAYRALGVWLKYVEYIIEQQVLAYRMNVESELLTKFSEAKEYVAPGSVVLERLQNNMHNISRGSHRVAKLLTTIRNIRDKTMHVASGLLASSPQLSIENDTVCVSSQDKLYEWKCNAAVAARYFNTLNIHPTDTSSVTTNSSEIVCTYPCILLRASFDTFVVVHAPMNFTLQKICPARYFCAEDLWEYVHAGDITPGQAFYEDYNMILPVAHTPLLMGLYINKARCFHSAINVTGDCLALTAVSLQYAKVFIDILLSSNRSFYADALSALVSFSYCITSQVLLPKLDQLQTMFSVDGAVISRDASAGLTCPLSISALVACADEAIITENAWNLTLRTLFSRLCETISGSKVIRSATGDHPGEMEIDYRLLLGKLQSVLRWRLHIEWSNGSLADKLAIVRENSASIIAILLEIVSSYLMKLDKYLLPTWNNVLVLLTRSLHLRNTSIGTLQSYFVSDSMDDVAAVSDSVFSLECSLQLPVVVRQGNIWTMRELAANDAEMIVGYIDAIAATNASPKIEYVPVVNPSYPTFSASHNRSLHIDARPSSWDTSKPVLNISFIGNVNSGKSTLGGHLLASLYGIPLHAIDNLAAEAAKLGLSESMKYAWILDRTRHERCGGFTVASTFHGFQTDRRRFNLVDNPGHKDYTNNASVGIFFADIALLVISAVNSEVQLAELSVRSQAEEHLVAAFCFGVKHVVVGVNKMDAVGYAQSAFESTKATVLKYTKKAGFKQSDVLFVPISALTEEGVLSTSPSMSWYSGPSLLQCLDEFPLPQRHLDKSFRLSVAVVRKVPGVGSVVCGKIDRGSIKVGDEIVILPGETHATVNSIESYHISLPVASAGDDVGLAIKLAAPKKSKAKQQNAIVPVKLRRGMMVALASEKQPTVFTKFEAQIMVVRGSLIKVGYTPTMTTHTESVAVRITKIISIIDRAGVVVHSNPSEVKPTETCICELEAIRPFAAETIHDAPKLSKFFIRENRIITSIGFIRSLIM